MKVYRISTTGKPPRSRFPNWTSLDIKEREIRSGRLTYEKFSGRPYPFKWKAVELYIENPLYPRPDFYNFGTGKFVCNERAREQAGEALEMAGELLPVSIEGESGEFYIFNCTNCINVLDREKSRWKVFGPMGQFRTLEQPAFYPQRFGEECLFKIAEDGGSVIYCLERTGDALDGEFKAVVEECGLKGLEFRLVWTNEKRQPERVRTAKQS